MQFQIAKTEPITGIAVNRGRISRRIKSLYHDIYDRLFTLREVEVTIEERGNQLVYTYKKDGYVRKA
jgi:hypothetical protein